MDYVATSGHITTRIRVTAKYIDGKRKKPNGKPGRAGWQGCVSKGTVKRTDKKPATAQEFNTIKIPVTSKIHDTADEARQYALDAVKSSNPGAKFVEG